MEGIFGNQVKRKLMELSHEYVILFAWLSAMRALPFLGVNGSFEFWLYSYGQDGPERMYRGVEKRVLNEYLIDIFRALDMTSSDDFVVRNVIRDNPRYDGDTALVSSARCAIYAVSTAVTAKVPIFDNAIFAATNTAVAAVNAAAFAIRGTKKIWVNSDIAAQIAHVFRDILIQDLEAMSNGTLQFDNDTASVYGGAWSSFQKALHDLDCAYWWEWYTALFSKGFILNDNDKEEIKVRLNAPKDIVELGAAAVGNYMQTWRHDKPNSY